MSPEGSCDLPKRQRSQQFPRPVSAASLDRGSRSTRGTWRQCRMWRRCGVCRNGPRRLRNGNRRTTLLALLERRDATVQVRGELAAAELQAGVERAELGELRARLVEAHLVNQLLEHERIGREEIDAPFPVVVADRP